MNTAKRCLKMRIVPGAPQSGKLPHPACQRNFQGILGVAWLLLFVVIAGCTDNNNSALPETCYGRLAFDIRIERQVRDTLGISWEAELTLDQLATMTSISASGIQTLDGIECCPNLQILDISGKSDAAPGEPHASSHAISLLPLVHLSKLRSLVLTNVKLQDITQLKYLTTLTHLDVSDNPGIRDLSPLSELTGLTSLSLTNCGLSDDNPQKNLQFLKPLFGLVELDLSGNTVQNVSSLASLSHLNKLYLSGNKVIDIAPLTSLANLSTLYLDNNAIHSMAALISSPYLKEGDVVSLVGNPLDCNDVGVLADELFVMTQGIDLAPACGCTTYCTDGGCTLTDGTFACTDCPGGRIGGRCDRLPPCEGAIQFAGSLVEKAVRGALQIPPESPVQATDMLMLDHLTIVGDDISQYVEYPDRTLWEVVGTTPITDLTGLHCAPNLTSLSISSPDIHFRETLKHLTGLTTLAIQYADADDLAALTDIPHLRNLSIKSRTPLSMDSLAELHELESLHLSVANANISMLGHLPHLTDFSTDALVTGIGALPNLTRVTLTRIGPEVVDMVGELNNRPILHMDLSGNQLTSLSFLKGFTRLTSLVLRDNLISDLSPLQGYEILSLDVSHNSIIDLSPLSTMSELNTLQAADNRLTNINPLKKNGQLTVLDISDNEVTDLTPLAHLTALQALKASGNAVTDINPLLSLPALERLEILQNPLADITLLNRMSTLTALHVSAHTNYDLGWIAAVSSLEELYVDGAPVGDTTDMAANDDAPDDSNNDADDDADAAVSIYDISYLLAIPGLKKLSLTNHPTLADVYPVAEMTLLTELTLRRTNVSDVLPIRDLANLKVLQLDDNRLKDISDLGMYPQLETLSLMDNRIEDMDTLLNMALPSDCTIWFEGNSTRCGKSSSNRQICKDLEAMGINIISK